MEKETNNATNENVETYTLRIEGLIGALKSERVRWLIDKEKTIKQNSKITDQDFKQRFTEIVRQEAERSMIMSELVKSGERTVGEIAFSTKMPQDRILRHMIALLKRGSTSVTGEKEGQYLFTAVESPE